MVMNASAVTRSNKNNIHNRIWTRDFLVQIDSKWLLFVNDTLKYSVAILWHDSLLFNGWVQCNSNVRVSLYGKNFHVISIRFIIFENMISFLNQENFPWIYFYRGKLFSDGHLHDLSSLYLDFWWLKCGRRSALNFYGIAAAPSYRVRGRHFWHAVTKLI